MAKRPGDGGPWGNRRSVAAFALLIPVMAIAAAGLALGVAHSQRTDAMAQHGMVEVVVAPGDTLWSIARRHVPVEVDLCAAVDTIMRENGLTGALVRPGQVLQVRVPIHAEETGVWRLARK